MAKKKPKKRQRQNRLTAQENEILNYVKRYTRDCLLSSKENRRDHFSSLPKKQQDWIRELISTKQPQLSIEYYKKGVEKKLIGEPQDKVFSGNIIQLPENYDDLYPDDQVNTWSPEEYFLHAIPCFTEGVIQIKDETSEDKSTCTQWKVNSTDIDNKELDVTIQVYTVMNRPEEPIWAPIVKLRYKTSFHEDAIDIGFVENDCINMSEICKMVPYSELHWSPFEIELWKNTAIYLAKLQEDTWTNNHEYDFNGTTVHLFLAKTTVTNLMLEQNRPTIRRERTSTTTPKIEIRTDFNPETQSQRRTRTIGPISIKSVSVPHAPTKKSVMKYMMESWNRRGHIRHYKSGKTVYIQPAVHHRHALKDKTTQPAPTTIKIQNPSPTDVPTN